MNLKVALRDYYQWSTFVLMFLIVKEMIELNLANISTRLLTHTYDSLLGTAFAHGHISEGIVIIQEDSEE